MRKDRKYLRIGLRKQTEPEYARTKRYVEHLSGIEMTDTAFAAMMIEEALRLYGPRINAALKSGRIPAHVIDPTN